MKNTSSTTRIVTGAPETRRPLGRRRLTGATLVLAWVVFWLNTALFPCCEALAAAFDGHSNEVSQSASAAQPAHDSDETHSEYPHPGPILPCGDTLDAGPAINAEHAGLQTDRSYLKWFAIDAYSPAGLTVADHSATPAPRDYRPPPSPYRLYLQTQRLLI